MKDTETGRHGDAETLDLFEALAVLSANVGTLQQVALDYVEARRKGHFTSAEGSENELLRGLDDHRRCVGALIGLFDGDVIRVQAPALEDEDKDAEGAPSYPITAAAQDIGGA